MTLKHILGILFLYVCIFSIGAITSYTLYPHIVIINNETTKIVNVTVESPPQIIYKEITPPVQPRRQWAYMTNVPGETLEQCAQRLRNDSKTDAEFVEEVTYYIMINIKYVTKSGYDVWSPERVWVDRKGDCSEMSLLATEMLKSQGYNATYIYGISLDGNGKIHARSRVVIDVDLTGVKNFVYSGSGLYPGEFIIN